MKTQFTIKETCVVSNDKVALTGLATGPLLSSGQRGHVSTTRGEVEVVIVSVGHVDPAPADSNAQLLQIRVLTGDPVWLKEATLNFD
jgi:hypothetical protein